MLIISRKKDQKIIVADDIEITILEVGRNRVRFGIKAPKHIPIQTRLKSSPPPEKPTEIVELEIKTASPGNLPNVVSTSKRR
jgi:hypothetical protein